MTQVLIIGGGPCGLMLALELGHRGIKTLLIERRPTTAKNPQANATQARTMEHFRRLGFASEIRASGLPEDYPPDIAYFTRFSKDEIARVKQPTAREARVAPLWAAENPHRISQKYVEAVMYKEALRLPSVTLKYGYELLSFKDENGISAVIQNLETGMEETVSAKFLYAADGAKSTTRKALGYSFGGDSGIERDFMGGKMLALYLNAPSFYDKCVGEKAWMYCSFNNQRRALAIAVDGKGEFAFHTALKPNEEAVSAEEAKALFYQAMGCEIPVEIISQDTWVAGKALVAKHFQKGNVFLGGDAIHLFTPTGGMGYNTAIEDAVNIGWKFAAVLKGQAPISLLDTYELERRPVAIRNTGFARNFADSVGLYKPSPAIEEMSEAGVASRKRAGNYLFNHATAEFNIPGFTLGARYETSPIIHKENIPSPPDFPTAYVPTGKAGGRAPHIWLSKDTSLYDEFGFDWTLLVFNNTSHDFVKAAVKLNIDLKILHLESAEAKDLYDCKLALIRPDQVIAWRGREANAEEVLKLVLGF